MGGGIILSKMLGNESKLEASLEAKYSQTLYTYGILDLQPEVRTSNIKTIASLSYDFVKFVNGALFTSIGAGPAFISAKGHSLMSHGRLIEAPSFSAVFPCLQIGCGLHSIGISNSYPHISFGTEILYSYCKGDKVNYSWDASQIEMAFKLFYHF